MAFYINNRNVGLCGFICNDEILVLKLLNSNENSYESYKLKCSVPRSNQELSEVSNSKEGKKQHVVSAIISNCGSFVSACDSNNFLHLWKYETNSWSHLSERRLVRKCQKIIFTNSGSEVIVADRGGDVFGFSVVDCQKEGKFLLGHISLIIDISISSNDKYLLTCDRDGKIRVSCYPNTYNIHSFCLGHQEFVSCVQCVYLSQELIFSASGDGSIRLWNFNSNNICVINLFENEVMSKMLESCDNGMSSATSLSCLLDAKQITFAVKKIRFSPRNKLCAISFYLIKGVAVYCLSDVKECQFIEFIPVESIPFDIFFNLTGDLIILQKNVSKPYSYFKYISESNVHFKDDSDTVALFEELKKFCGNINNLYEVQDDYETLLKKNYDKDDSVEIQSNSMKKSKIT